MNKIKILLTAFEPFGDEKINPSAEVVREIVCPQNVHVERIFLPVLFGRSFDTMLPVIERFQPHYILMFGQAGGSKAIRLEKIATNLASVRDADPLNVIVDNVIDPDGTENLTSTLAVQKACDYLTALDLPCEVSTSAGTFVCNYLLYRCLDYCKRNLPSAVACFVHLPFFPSQVTDKPNVPSCDKKTSLRAAQTLVNLIADGKL